MAENSKEFLLNFKNKVEIDVAGNKSLDAIESADFALLAAGISTITPAAADTTDATPYYDGEGFTESEVTGKNITFAISGHRVFGDKAQDFVAKHFLSIGDELRTLARWTDAKGNKVQAVVTMTSIVPFGGAANAKQTFSFTLAFNGKPVLEAGGVISPESVALNKTTLSLVVGANETLTATVLPADATDKTVTWKSSDATIAGVDSTGKVSGFKAGTADITVTTKDGSKTAKCTVTVTAA